MRLRLLILPASLLMTAAPAGARTVAPTPFKPITAVNDSTTTVSNPISGSRMFAEIRG